MSLNMKKEIRAELRILTKARNKVDRDWLRRQKEIRRAFQIADKVHEQAIADITKVDKKSERIVTKELAKINRRILILEGRLS